MKPITLPRQNQTIMHIAALGGSTPVIEYLYSKGVPLDPKNSAGETPLDLADHQERYREAIERQGAEGDPEKLKKIVTEHCFVGRNPETHDRRCAANGLPLSFRPVRGANLNGTWNSEYPRWLHEGSS